MAGGWIGQIAVFSDDPDAEKSDFRRVPASDNGRGYSDRGGFGGYSPTDKLWSETEPRETKYFGGYGVSDDDARRGYIAPDIREDPAYDKVNYSDRSTLPKSPDEDQSSSQAMRQDWEFRSRNMRSKGFLTRPRLPTERS
jgi:hypothetical protein